ncbi:hypothetical protein Poly59_20150 [Rubripirellula reticaptiva]|uniref:Transposase n=1 Tax=Rubripirellula reticaptiva TaxID=2528013 RepID=A0A5C6F3K2_9BACT|nr:hypothetical protein Poly59_20150 [Rubripirellula reticaptiva]
MTRAEVYQHCGFSLKDRNQGKTRNSAASLGLRERLLTPYLPASRENTWLHLLRQMVNCAGK